MLTSIFLLRCFGYSSKARENASLKRENLGTRLSVDIVRIGSLSIVSVESGTMIDAFVMVEEELAFVSWVCFVENAERFA